MSRAIRFDPSTHAGGLTKERIAELVAEIPDPSIPVNGVTSEVATMSENAPHSGEMHPDGDEVLYLIAGRVQLTLEGDPAEKIEACPLTATPIAGRRVRSHRIQ